MFEKRKHHIKYKVLGRKLNKAIMKLLETSSFVARTGHLIIKLPTAKQTHCGLSSVFQSIATYAVVPTAGH